MFVFYKPYDDYEENEKEIKEYTPSKITAYLIKIVFNVLINSSRFKVKCFGKDRLITVE